MRVILPRETGILELIYGWISYRRISYFELALALASLPAEFVMLPPFCEILISLTPKSTV